MVRRGEIVKKLVMALLLCAGAAWGQPSGGIPPRPQRVLFANLGTPQDSNWRYCTDCAATSPCTGSGSGAFAYRVGSAWNCNVGAPALATPVSAANGGTGQSTYTKGDMLAAPGGATLNKVAVGTDGFVWTADAASTNGVKWAAAAAPGATTSLSNLASVQINTSLLPATDGAINLGSVSKGYATVYAGQLVTSLGSVIQFNTGIGPVFLDGVSTHSITFDMSLFGDSRIISVPNDDGTMVLIDEPQTETNKTFTSPIVSNLKTSGTTPAVSNTTANSCGTTAATIAGNNMTGVVTVGATAGTNCTITFTVAAPTRRQCTVTNETTANLSRSTYLTTTTSTVEGTFVAGDKISYVCAVY